MHFAVSPSKQPKHLLDYYYLILYTFGKAEDFYVIKVFGLTPMSIQWNRTESSFPFDLVP
jgi:hypothetical protein